MNISLVLQLYGFGWMVLGGMASGVLFDFFAVLRTLYGNRRITTNVSDLIMWSCLAVGIFLLNFYANDGILRWYCFFALILGATLYFLTLSRLMRFLLRITTHLFVKILRLILKIVLTTVVFLYKIICGMFSFVLRLLSPLGKGACRMAKAFAHRRRTFWLAVKKK